MANISHTEMTWWLSPYRTKNYQWMWGYRKVRMVVLDDEHKRQYLAKSSNQLRIEK